MASIVSSQICRSSSSFKAAQKQTNFAVVSASPPPSMNPDEVTPSKKSALKFGAKHVISLFVPIAICMAVVIITMGTVGYYSEQEGNSRSLINPPFISTQDADTGTHIALSLVNAVEMIGLLAVVTCLTNVLNKYKMLRVFEFLSTLIPLFVLSFIYVDELLKHFNAAVHWAWVFVGVLSWACLGTICTYWRWKLILQQAYKISIAALLALYFIKYLPGWTVWTGLGAVSIWDLFAVLSPYGPIRILVETAQSRNEPFLSAFIYTTESSVCQHVGLGIVSLSTLTTTLSKMNAANQRNNVDNARQNGFGNGPSGGINSSTSAHNLSSGACTSAVKFSRKRDSNGKLRCALTGDNDSTRQHPSQNNWNDNSRSGDENHAERGEANVDSDLMEEDGIGLGLGDFIFYCVLVGKASSYGDWYATLACCIAILVGLALTLMLLALYRRALPALPISITAGIFFFVVTREIITPLITTVSMHQICSNS